MVCSRHGVEFLFRVKRKIKSMNLRSGKDFV